MAITIQEQVALAPYTIYKIGGPARFFVEVATKEEAQEAVAYAATQKIPFFVLGAGSNILIADTGFDGMIIRMIGRRAYVVGETLIADAGVMMARASALAAQEGLTGFEWAVGVPGTIGGSVRGNAGCFGGEMQDVVEKVVAIEGELGKIKEFGGSECMFAYRDSVFKHAPEWIVAEVTLMLKKGNQEAIRSRMQKIIQERASKQDIGTQCAGCIFKNISWEEIPNKEKLIADFPDFAQFIDRMHMPASFLIDQAGLKEERIGSIVISPKHANFFVNEGGGSADDVKKLIACVKEEVKKKFQVSIKEEIQYVGFR
ncbi:MAG: UDP-N-acetylmuramate dehydrogenase [Parcubacteria group bacterium Gr01-1014_66]|nr:MAG: UDP-N-acetylmuramate dehydrogenase [Parcubacteria group bacterium Gr01-1014_66]